jgi:hypothetical protein
MMPVRKFRSIEEMDDARHELWCEPGEECFRRIARLWKRSARINPRKFPKGVFKYRSIEEAQADRERLLTEHVRRLEAERRRSGKLRVVQHPAPRA